MWVTKRGVARWVRPAIEHAQDVPLVGEARSGVFFNGVFVQSLFLCSTFCFIFITCFSLFCFRCVLFSKKKSFGMVLSFEFFVCYLIVVKLVSGFQKNSLSSFNLVLTWFGNRGFFFLSHAISLWFYVLGGFMTLGCVGYFSLLYNSFRPS